MGFFPKKLQAVLDLVGGLKVSGTSVTTTAAELNKLASATATTAELNRLHKDTAQALVANGAITVKNGVCTIAKTSAGVVAATLDDPVATTDDFKVLMIINAQTQANTVTSASSFGGGGASYDVITFTNVLGANVRLLAYQGKWYVIGGNAYAIA